MDKDIKRAEERLEYLSSDKETIEIYKAREKSLHERANMINGAKEEGRKEGIKEGKKEGRKEEKIEIAKNLLVIGMKLEKIANVTGLSTEEIKSLNQ
ncbi:hypothetical protein ACFIJ5_09290 [Haloimpatiens sp. FM7330]|uniref:hypothetical protein n=1 Tax=Haloimpatiens sp. FM7330 TaxID=3298610 RepID=UPI0036436C23